MEIARLSLGAYGWDRRIIGSYQLAGSTSKASRGIAAGSPFATAELKVYLLSVVKDVQLSCTIPNQIPMSIFVDDFAITISGDKIEKVAEDIIEVYKCVSHSLGQIGLPIAHDKTELIATSDRIVELVNSVVKLSHKHMVCKKLGIDVSYQVVWVSKTKNHKGAKPRTKANISQRRARMVVFQKRAKTCAMLFGNKRYAKVMHMGLVTGALYGTDVSPISDQQLDRMKIEIIKSEGLSMRGTPNSWKWAALGPDKDPEFRAKSGVLLRLAREVWISSARTQWKKSHTDVLQPRELTNMFQQINEHEQGINEQESIILQWIADSIKFFGIIVHSPVSWQINGEKFDISICTKHNIKTELVKAWDARLSKHIAGYAQTQGHRLDIPRIRHMANSMSLAHRSIYVQALAGTVYTWQRANKIGAQISSKCPLGCNADDTMMHRLHTCCKAPNRLVLAGGMVISDILRPSIQEGTELRFKEVEEATYHNIEYANGNFSTKECNAFVFDGIGEAEHIEMFTDGSCQAHGTIDAIASGAGIQITEMAEDMLSFKARTASWLAPRHLHATSFIGEYIGAYISLRDSTSNKPMSIWTDSAALISAWHRATAMGPQFQNKWDGLFRQHWDTFSEHDELSLHKVKAHRDVKTAVDNVDLRKILGNLAADFMANKCIADHTEASHGDRVVLLDKNIRKGTKALVRALDEARSALGIPPKPAKNVVSWARKNKANSDGRQCHHICWGTSGFHCKECFRRFPTLPKPGQACSTAPRALRGIVAQAAELGHSPAAFLMGGLKPGVLAACLACSAYTMDKCRNLGTRCPRKHDSRGNATNRFLKGLHPTCRGTCVIKGVHWKSVSGAPGGTGGANFSGIAAASTPTLLDLPVPPMVAGFSQEEQDNEWDSAEFAEFFGTTEDPDPFCF